MRVMIFGFEFGFEFESGWAGLKGRGFGMYCTSILGKYTCTHREIRNENPNLRVIEF